MLALASSDELVRLMREISKEFQKIARRSAAQGVLVASCRVSQEDDRHGARHRRRAGRNPQDAGGKTPIWISSPSTSPRMRKQGKIDPVLGRDFEIRQVVDILMRRRQNNPILTGEAGVGKTAVVEGFALRVGQRRCAASAA